MAIKSNSKKSRRPNSSGNRPQPAQNGLGGQRGTMEERLLQDALGRMESRDRRNANISGSLQGRVANLTSGSDGLDKEHKNRNRQAARRRAANTSFSLL